jgi:ribonuclease Y
MPEALMVIAGLIVGIFTGIFAGMFIGDRGISKAREKANLLIDEAEKQAEKNKKQTILEAKKEIHNLKMESDKEIKERKAQVASNENKIMQREQSLDRRSSNLDKRENNLDNKEVMLERKKQSIEDKTNRLDKMIDEQNEKLIEISRFTIEQARDLIFKRVEDEMAQEIAAYIKEEEEKAKLTVDKNSKHLLAHALQKYAQEVTSERTVSVVALPNDEMKGRIIGREGRNIRTIEALTGVDLIIDDTPEAVVLSGFDPIRR